jgi:hypothetical protein
VERLREQIRHITAFDCASGVHHGDPIGDLGDQLQIVADEQNRDVELAADAIDQLHHLRLHRHVQRRGWFVGDQQARVGRHRQRDHDPLPHAARQFVWIGAQALFWIWNTDEGQQFLGPIARRIAAQRLVGAYRIG